MNLFTFITAPAKTFEQLVRGESTSNIFEAKFKQLTFQDMSKSISVSNALDPIWYVQQWPEVYTTTTSVVGVVTPSLPAVPEPGTLGMLLIGLTILAFFTRKLSKY